MWRTATVFICLAVAGRCEAGKYNPVLDIGDKAPVWKKLPGVDGKQHSLSDLKDFDQVLVVFTCNSCPYAVDYETRIKKLSKQLRELNVALVAINVNKNPDDDLAAMKVRAAEQEFNFPYLYDETQQIARDFGATYTPECFLLDRQRKIAYMGALDDNPAEKMVKQRHALKAVQSLQAGGKPAVSETVAIGCRIRMERRRRRSR